MSSYTPHSIRHSRVGSKIVNSLSALKADYYLSELHEAWEALGGDWVDPERYDIDECMCWSDTPQGHNFWSDLYVEVDWCE